MVEADVKQNFPTIPTTTLETEPVRVVKKVINPAIYVESAIYDMAPFKRSPFCLKDDEENSSLSTIKVVKKCVCTTDQQNCPCHPNNREKIKHNDKKTKVRISTSVPKTCFKSDNKIEYDGIDVSFSLACFQNNRSTTDDESEANKNFKLWLSRKLKEKKEREEEFLRLKEQQELERQKHLEIERENFKKWLNQKKKEEEERRRKKEQELEEEKLKNELKEKRNMENDLKYQLWLKKKEEEFLCRKIKEQMETMKLEEEKQRKREENERAYEEWLRNSKNKPKPIPLNKGMETLRTAASVTYVNPTPWQPNIEKPKPKPISQ